MSNKLVDGILKLSVSDTWETAKVEWVFVHAYQKENQTCLCGKHPIKNICIIENTINSNKTEVGNCCVKTFLSIEKGTHIFTSLNRIKSDSINTISEQTLDYLKEKKVIDFFEHTRYKMAIKKKKLPPIIADNLKIVNQKFIAFCSLD